MRKKIIFITLIIILVISISYSYAQQDRPQARRNLRENLFTLRALRMTEALDLSEEQTAAIFPELNRAEKEKAELQQKLAGEIRDLRAMIKEGKAQPAEFEARVARIIELRKKIREREEVFEQFLFGQLTPVQKAKYIIFNVDFNTNLMMRMRRAAQAGQKIK
ncbi:MAG: hypothetical protein ACPLRX_07970 [Candidatus Saccharicenans sp.]